MARAAWNRDETQLHFTYDSADGGQHTFTAELEDDVFRDERGQVVGRVLPERSSQQRRRLSLAIGSVPAKPSLLADTARRAVKSSMVAAANMVEVAALVGDTARATMLAALMSGQSLTGGELAFLAHVSRPTASEHLAKLVAARLLSVTKKRRFNYYRIASPLVARMLESIKAVAAIEVPPRYQPRSMRDEALRFARTCYDHLAGQVAVAIADALVAKDYIVLGEDGGMVTDAGADFLADFGVNLKPESRSRRIFCGPCLDWSERRYHLAGHVGSEICRCCLQRGWFARERDSRALRLMPAGVAGLFDSLGVEITPPLASSRAGGISASRLAPEGASNRAPTLR